MSFLSSSDGKRRAFPLYFCLRRTGGDRFGCRTAASFSGTRLGFFARTDSQKCAGSQNSQRTIATGLQSNCNPPVPTDQSVFLKYLKLIFCVFDTISALLSLDLAPLSLQGNKSKGFVGLPEGQTAGVTILWIGTRHRENRLEMQSNPLETASPGI